MIYSVHYLRSLNNGVDKFKEALNSMRVIDSRGGFESDDEIGVMFKSIKDIIKELKDDIEHTND